MTREEAIKTIESAKHFAYDVIYEEAFDMAIKALEQIPKLQNRCHALTYGQMCIFCPYECEHKKEVEPQESEE